MSAVYWEKQGNDLLCGVHCLNSLLQGPFFNEIDLALYAQELDKQEKILLEQGGTDSKDFLEFVAGDSHNVEDGGNYSIQVLERALKRYNLKCKNVNADELIDKDLSNQTGFICHRSLHWYAIRKVDGVWYDLNSLYKTGPRHISDFYLSALLIQFQEQGQNIFLVSGDYPNNQKVLDNAEFEKHQLLILNEDIQPYKNLKKKNNIQSNKKKDNQMDEEWDEYEDFSNYDQQKSYNLRNKSQNKQVNQSKYQDEDIKGYQKQFDEMSQKKKYHENQQNKMVDEQKQNQTLSFYQKIQLINNKYKQKVEKIDNNQSNQNSFYKKLSKQQNQNSLLNDQSKQVNIGFQESKKIDNHINNKDYNQKNQNSMSDLIEIQQEQIALTIWIDSQIRYTENFHLFETIEDIHTFIKQKQRDLSHKKFILYTNVPDKMFFNNKEKFISDYGLYSGQVLHIKLV
ncbi:josephin protein (macronuclear) [Tetrahymena thermophila SB210]|uniref:ubiquitinyl hydrolase 1 n=1 Tax=Tetrahymena thermophila (strain SB210) TaxID=312017 RepID=I7MCW4_TETTS|nr:josephin protein [Tetrahymena thermophila SB210]EAR85046.1 josephin protein [Tetrahymena thermophila SB210]|eukprot:XP_001032709.1 josephin protein [Tetrahymena thermophila SB210]